MQVELPHQTGKRAVLVLAQEKVFSSMAQGVCQIGTFACNTSVICMENEHA